MGETDDRQPASRDPDLASLPPAVSFDEYLEVKAQIELLQARLDAMKPSLVEALTLQGGRVEYGGYELCVRSRVVYEYSEQVAAAERHCRELKRLEQQNVTATVQSYTEFPYVRAL